MWPEPRSLEAAGDRQELEPVTHLKPSPSAFHVWTNFVTEKPCPPQVEGSWGTTKCNSSATHNKQQTCRRELCISGSSYAFRKGLRGKAAAKASGEGEKKELQLLQEITSYDIEMPWNKCSFPLHPRTQGLHESSALTCMADKGFHP